MRSASRPPHLPACLEGSIWGNETFLPANVPHPDARQSLSSMTGPDFEAQFPQGTDTLSAFSIRVRRPSQGHRANPSADSLSQNAFTIAGREDGGIGRPKPMDGSYTEPSTCEVDAGRHVESLRLASLALELRQAVGANMILPMDLERRTSPPGDPHSGNILTRAGSITRTSCTSSPSRVAPFWRWLGALRT